MCARLVQLCNCNRLKIYFICLHYFINDNQYYQSAMYSQSRRVLMKSFSYLVQMKPDHIKGFLTVTITDLNILGSIALNFILRMFSVIGSCTGLTYLVTTRMATTIFRGSSNETV